MPNVPDSDEEEMIENLDLLLNLDTLENSDLWDTLTDEKLFSGKIAKQTRKVSHVNE